MTAAVRILLVSGSTRSGSTNTAALRTAEAVAADGVVGLIYEGLVGLPPFNPDDDGEPPHPAVVDLRQQITSCDAVLFCTPEYAGALPGSFKNLLDWTVGGGELYGKPVAWMNVAAEGRGLNAEISLASVLRYVGADAVEAACVRLPVPRDAIDPDGLVADVNFQNRVGQLLRTMADHVRSTRT